MKRIFLNSAGFTMVELLLAALFSLMVMASLYGFFREQLFTLLSHEVKIATLEEARGALDIMIRELRNAGAWTSGKQPSGCSRIVTATATNIEVQADLDGNGDCGSATGEDVTYAFLTTSTSTCPGGRITRNSDCLVSNVVIPTGSSLFTYFDRTNTQLAVSPPVSLIKRVKITFAVRVSNPDPRVGGNITSTLSSSVEFRN